MTDERVAAEQSDDSDPLIGRTVAGRYRIERLLGRGGMGAVYDAVHTELGRSAAVKVLAGELITSDVMVERFLREAKLAASVHHPNIVDVYDLGRLPDGRPFLVMDRLRGRGLDEAIEHGETLPPKQVASIVTQVAAALDVVHKHDLVHRDIKPENLFIVELDDGTEVVKVLDFGLVGLAVPDPEYRRLTRTGLIYGTPPYMSPEAAGDRLPDKRGDVYALAVVAFELLTGQIPFDSPNPLQILTMKLQEDPPTLRAVAGCEFPEELERVLARGLARYAQERYPTAGELARDLRKAAEACGDEPFKPLSVAGSRRGPRPSERRTASHRSSPRDRSSPIGPKTAEHRVPLGDSPESPEPAARTPTEGPQRRRFEEAATMAATPKPARRAVATDVPTLSAEDAGLPTRNTRTVVAVAAVGVLAIAGIVVALATGVPSSGAAPDEIAEGDVAQADVAQTETAGPETTGLETTGPETTGPETTGPETTGPETAGPETAGPETAGPETVDDPASEPAEASADMRPVAPTVERPAATARAEESVDPPAREPSGPSTRELTEQGTRALVAGRVGEAVELLRTATRQSPGHAPAWRSLGLSYERLGRRREARAAYERYLRLAPNANDADRIREKLDRL